MIPTLGDLIDTLAALDPNLPITLDGATGLGLSSWRGVYAEVSLDHGSTFVGTDTLREAYGSTSWLTAIGTTEYDPAHTVGELLAVASAVADGGWLTGYKGGAYQMSRDTRLWADEWGDCEGRRLAGVSITKAGALLATLAPREDT